MREWGGTVKDFMESLYRFDIGVFGCWVLGVFIVVVICGQE